MKNGWQPMTLKDLCVVDWGNTNLTKSSYVEGGKFLAVSAAGCDGRIGHSEHSKHTPVLSAIGAQCGKMFFPEEDFTAIKNTITLTPRDGKCVGKFLYYLFTFVELPQRGAGQPFISKGDIQSFEVTCPLIPEQQRIVGVLDEAFAGIATAQANAEKNLQNARALFESHLQSVFTQRGKGWVEKPLIDLCIVDWGNTDLTKSSYVEGGKFLAVSAAGCDGRIGHKEHAKYTPVLSAIGAQCGRMFLPEEDFTAIKNTITLTPINGKCTGRFLYRLLTHVELPKRGAAQPFIAKGDILAFKVIVPESLTVQQQMEESLSELEIETQRLASLYERKLAALEALKKSLLHQAFTGELTKESSPPVIAAQLPLLPPIPARGNITPINLHAGILAIGYQAYEQANRQWHFQHVVAEKFSHMTEALVGIDLGRNPVQDPQGPDDFPHLIKVEHRARMANYFTFQNGKKGKVFVKGRGFESLVAQTREALGELNQKLDAVIKLMLPLDLQPAEVVATVYAAWNNLLLDRQTPSDEQIVRAARENWHPDKLKIPRENFFKTIDWIRKKNICPQGKGKRVVSKA